MAKHRPLRAAKTARNPVVIVREEVARSKILAGVGDMVKAVGATYGPRGRTVMLERPGGVLSTKDGVSVAWEFEPACRLQRLGTRVVQEACDRVNKRCGDGTTTTAILVHAILRESYKWISAGTHPVLLAKEMRRLIEEFEQLDMWELLRPELVESEDLLREIALAASNRDAEAAAAIVESLGLVGSEGMIVVEEGKGRGVEVVHKTGMEWGRGYESSDLLSEDEGLRHFDVPLVALVDAEILTLDDISPILEEATQFPHPLVIVSRGMFGEAVKVLVANDRELRRADGGTFEAIAVRCPGHVDFMRDHLDDLAALTGATVFDPEVATGPFESQMFGAVQTASVGRHATTFVAYEDKYPLIERRVETLTRLADSTGSTHDVEEIRTRIAKLTDGLCVMRVGGHSDTEIRERRARIEDALSAVRVAIESGVAPGAGVSYLAIGKIVSEVSGKDLSTVRGITGRLLAEALTTPLRTLAHNAGSEPAVVLARLQEAVRASEANLPADALPGWESGWDATLDTVRDLRESPVLCDPLAVVKTVLQTAVSTASTLLTAEIALTRSSGRD